MPCASSAAVTLPVCAGSRPVESSWYEGAPAILRSRNAMPSTATVETARIPLVRAGRARIDWMKEGIGSQLDLGVEDVLGGLDGLRADLRGQLHGELGALDGHDDRCRVGGLARRELLRRGGGAVLALGQALDRRAEQVAEAATGRLDRVG